MHDYSPPVVVERPTYVVRQPPRVIYVQPRVVVKPRRTIVIRQDPVYVAPAYDGADESYPSPWRMCDETNPCRGPIVDQWNTGDFPQEY